MSIIAVPVRQRRVLADLIPASVLADIALVVGAAAFVGVLAQISIPLGFTPVPITGQTLGVMLAGAALGWWRAGLSMLLYMLAGLAGLPWFAGHASGYVGSNFGYLIGFVVAGALLGWLAARGNDRTVTRAVVAMIIGDFVIFVIGVPWLAVSIHVSLAKAISLGFTPFIPGEIIKCAVAGVALPSAWLIVDKTKRAGSSGR
jgi:biotin transport system substrate-specific component